MNARTGQANPTVTAAELATCVSSLEAAIAEVFVGLRAMAEAVENEWRLRGARPFSADDVTTFQPGIFDQLDAQRVIDSAGYVMSEFALDGVRRHLEWWHRGTGPTFQPLILNVEPGAPDCYDYYAMEWFFAALSQQRRFISGPHIDLPCADVCIMTFTDPIVVAGPSGPEVLGVAGADVALSRFESMILPPLRRLGTPALLVNQQRRVITSSDAAWMTGDKLPTLPVAGAEEWQAAVSVTPDLGWTLAVRA